MRIAVDIDSTLHHYWDQFAAVAKQRFGVDLPYETQHSWGVTGLRPEQNRACIAETHAEKLHCSFDKISRCVELEIDVLIDDSPINLRNAAEVGITPATIMHPWNRDLCEEEDIVCASDWPTLAQKLEPVLA